MTETAISHPCPNPDCVFMEGHDPVCSNQMGQPLPPLPRYHNDADGGFDPEWFAPRHRQAMQQISQVMRSVTSSVGPYADSIVVRSEGTAYATAQAADIFQRLLPEWSALFLAKNKKYKAVGNDLGPRGVFPDINRKTGILRDRIWDGADTVGEPTREVILDLIGHLFLMLHQMDIETSGEKSDGGRQA